MARRKAHRVSKKARAESRDAIYQEVTNLIIEKLKEGTAPWVCPWTRDGSIGGFPVSMNSSPKGKPYQGINIVLLWIRGHADARWYTWRTVEKLGAAVFPEERKGYAKIVSISNWPYTEETKSGEEVERIRTYAKWSRVYNHCQIEWPESHDDCEPEIDLTCDDEWAINADADKIIESSGATILEGRNAAYYNLSKDIICMPPKDKFEGVFGKSEGSSHWYATLLHELTHWTGSSSRLDREIGKADKKKYAFEELVAEMGSAFLCAAAGVEGKLQHPSYIDSWIKCLEDDHRAIFRASSLAQKASSFLLDLADGEAKQ